MKEIIYLDTDLINSMLAQLDEGIINSFSIESNVQESESEGVQSSRGKNAGLKGQFKLGTGILPGGELTLGSNLGSSGNETTVGSKTFLEGEKDILNKAFHDFTLDILEQKLIENKLLTSGPDFKEGDLFLGENSFKFYDFELTKNVIDHKSLQNIMLYSKDSNVNNIEQAIAILERKRKGKLTAADQNKIHYAEEFERNYESLLPAFNLFNVLETFSSYADQAFKNLAIIKAGNIFAFLNKNYLRESSVNLSFRTDKSRQIKFLVRIIGVKDEVYDGSNIPDMQPENIDQIPTLIFDTLLGSFGIIKENDVLVTPIAIYYE